MGTSEKKKKASINGLYKSLGEKFQSLVKSFSLSLSISWKASPGHFLYRIAFELIGIIIPVVTAFIGKEIINLLVSAVRSENVMLSINHFARLLLISFAVQFFNAVLQRINEIISGVHQDLIINFINLEIMKKSAAIDISYFDSPKFQNELMMARRDSQALQSMTWTTISVIKSVMQLFVTMPILLMLHWSLPLILILLKAPSFIIEKKFTHFTYSWMRNRAPEERKMGYVQSVITSKQFAKDLRLFNLFGELMGRYTSYWKKWFVEKKDLAIKRGKWGLALSILPQIGNTGISFFLGIEIILQKLTLGDYGFYNGISGQASGAINSLVNSIIQAYDSEIKIANFRAFLEWKTNLQEGGTLVPPECPEIEFRNISFKYPSTDKYILKNLSFKIRPNEKVALIGLNGAGKSTIVKLMMRYYDQDEGQILMNGTDIRQFDIEKFRKLFTAVFQDYSYFAFSARENITLSDLENADDEARMLDACDLSGVKDVIPKWKNGLDSFITKQFEEDGEELSGGEWQKLALARAFFRRADIVVLDEPTAALDPEAEHNVFLKFAQLTKGKSAIFISHRLSSVTMADKIILLENGCIMEEGSHNELIAKGGRYAYLFNLQAQKYVNNNDMVS